MIWRRTALLLWLLAVTGTLPARADEPERIKPGEFIPASPAQPAPDITVGDPAGNHLGLADLRGKPLLINLWATWCQPCLREMPSLERLQASLGDRLTVLAISEDHGGTKVVLPFVDEHGFDKLKIYLDPQSEVGRAFKARGLPTTILIDGAGEVQGRVEGAAEWDTPKMLAVIEPFLGAADSKGALNGPSR
jgi:thiol-disulfide isomerase/thioredoxin